MLILELLGKILAWIPPCEGREDLFHTSAVLLVGLLSWESPHFVLVLYMDESSNYHTGYPMARRSFSQVLESNVLRGPYSFDEATHNQMELAFDSVLDRCAVAAPGRRLLRRAWAASGRRQPGEGTRRGPT